MSLQFFLPLSVSFLIFVSMSAVHTQATSYEHNFLASDLDDPSQYGYFFPSLYGAVGDENDPIYITNSSEMVLTGGNVGGRRAIYNDFIDFIDQDFLSSDFEFSTAMSLLQGGVFAATYITTSGSGYKHNQNTVFGMRIDQYGLTIFDDAYVDDTHPTGHASNNELLIGADVLDDAIEGTWSAYTTFTYSMSVDSDGALSVSLSDNDGNSAVVYSGDGMIADFSSNLGSKDAFLGFQGKNASFSGVEISGLAVPEVSQYGLLMGIICWAQACLRRRRWLAK